MQRDSIEISESNVLIVEGQDEKLFFDALLNYMGITIQVLPIGGKTKIRSSMELLAISPNFPIINSIGIVRDADSDPNAAFQSVKNALRLANNNLEADVFPIPDVPLVTVGNELRLSVMILPKIDKPGMLEDICLEAVKNDCAIECIDEFFGCIAGRNCLMPENASKARIQIFLASRKEPGKRLGEAAKAGYFSWESEAFNRLKDFLVKLYKPETT
jgi:hypothetical protein